MFAVIKTGGKQYRVAADDLISVDKVAGKPGELIQFGEVLVLGGDNLQLGTPTVAGASVAGEVVEQGRGAKIIAFKKRRRKNSRRKRGHRQEFTLIRITEILTEGRKPTPRPKAEAKAKPETPASAEDDAGGTAKPAKGKAAAKAKNPGKKKPQSKPKAAAKSGGAAVKKPSRASKGKSESKGKKK
jgi:large subunit ribosomal protein L21